jgi:hypothetical protein
MTDTETELQTLTRRVGKLEAQNHQWRLVGCVLALFGSSFLVMGAKPIDRIEQSILRATTVETSDIILKDKEGHVCARLSVTPIVDRVNDHTSIVTHSNSPDLAVLEIYDDKGHPVWTAPPSPTLLPAKKPTDRSQILSSNSGGS